MALQFYKQLSAPFRRLPDEEVRLYVCLEDRRSDGFQTCFWHAKMLSRYTEVAIERHEDVWCSFRVQLALVTG